VTSPSELRAAVRFPCVVKTSIGTASRGIWFVRGDAGLLQVLQELAASEAFADEVLVQDLVAGATEKAQAVFSHGKLLGFHAYRQIAAGAGGGEAIKQSVRRPGVRADVATIGERLGWHGALSVDIIMPEQGSHLFIDCNPRLVEPMSAYLAGVDLVEVLLEVSSGKTPSAAPDSRQGVRTHLAMQALLGCAVRGGTRREIFRECIRVAAGRGPYTDSIEELTPVRQDWISAVPHAMTALALLANPKLAGTLSKKGWGAHLLGIETIRLIEGENFSRVEA
jgi:predicted ATP-grasp superfamily ATP-dependent carboligase